MLKKITDSNIIAINGKKIFNTSVHEMFADDTHFCVGEWESRDYQNLVSTFIKSSEDGAHYFDDYIHLVMRTRGETIFTTDGKVIALALLAAVLMQRLPNSSVRSYFVDGLKSLLQLSTGKCRFDFGRAEDADVFARIYFSIMAEQQISESFTGGIADIYNFINSRLDGLEPIKIQALASQLFSAQEVKTIGHLPALIRTFSVDVCLTLK